MFPSLATTFSVTSTKMDVKDTSIYLTTDFTLLYELSSLQRKLCPKSSFQYWSKISFWNQDLTHAFSCQAYKKSKSPDSWSPPLATDCTVQHWSAIWKTWMPNDIVLFQEDQEFATQSICLIIKRALTATFLTLRRIPLGTSLEVTLASKRESK